MPLTNISTIMDNAAALMNDAARSRYTYTVQVPYVNMALNDLQEIYELNDLPVVDTVSAVMTVPIGVDFIGYPPTVPIGGTPYLPTNLIEPEVLWERITGINPYIEMKRVDVLPRYMEGIQISQFLYYTWQSQEIRFFPSVQRNDIKMDYKRNLFAGIATSVDTIAIVNAQSFLQYRTGALLAEFCAENKTRADELNAFAGRSLDTAIGIGTKGRQAIMTRHRPFRSAYKRRSM